MEKWRIQQAREEIAQHPKLRAALAVAEIGHKEHEMKQPGGMAKRGIKLSFLEHHILEIYVLARAAGLDPNNKYDKLKLACILLHDVVEDSDKQKARGVPDSELIDTREKLAKVLAEKLSSYGYDEKKAKKFANRVSEITAEDTNLDLLFESKRTTQVVRARSGMSDFAKLVKQLDVLHHMITAITLPPSVWTAEKRMATVFKGYEVGRSCSTGIEQLDNLAELLAVKAIDSIKTDSEGKGDENFDVFSLIDQARNYKRKRVNTDYHISSRPLFLSRFINNGIKGVYLDDSMQVCSYASVVKPDHNFMDKANDSAERVRDEFEKQYGMAQPILTGDLAFDDTQFIRVMHLDKPMSISEFLGVASKVEGAICEEFAIKLDALEKSAAKGEVAYLSNGHNGHNGNNVIPFPKQKVGAPSQKVSGDTPWLPLAGITVLLSAVGYLSKGNKQKKQLEDASVKQANLFSISIPLK